MLFRSLGLGAIVVAGRLVLRPIMRSVARTRSNELVLAACLFIVIAAALIAAVSGLSMALGAFVAGLLLAETEFRREVEVTVEPFKGLLLGMFFVSVGVGLDLDGLIAQPLMVLAIALGVVGLKTLAVMGLGRLFRLPGRAALEAGLVLGPAGEFAFVVIGTAVGGRVIEPPRFVTSNLYASDNLAELRRMGRDPQMIFGTRPDTVYGLVTIMDGAPEALRKVRAPVFYLYGAHDEFVPPKPTFKAAAALKPTDRTAYYPDGWHILLRDLNAERVWGDVLAFVRDPSGPLPSGPGPIPRPGERSD